MDNTLDSLLVVLKGKQYTLHYNQGFSFLSFQNFVILDAASKLWLHP